MVTSKAAPDATMDTFLAKIATATSMVVCSGASNPADRAAVLAAALATSPMTPGLGSGDYTAADDATGALGRKVTMTAKNGVAVTASGDATCIALIDGTSIIYITTCTTQTLTSGNTVNIPAWKIQIGDPT
jgi:hypothetical protein